MQQDDKHKAMTTKPRETQLFTSVYLKSQMVNKDKFIEQHCRAQSEYIHYIFDIFLSHRFLDKRVIEGLYLLLSEMGYRVYVDWIVDPHLNRNEVSGKTAETVRHRMDKSRSLLYALSANSPLSAWMPWELAYMHGRGCPCAIVPVLPENDRRKVISRTEYLELYPVMVSDGHELSPSLYVDYGNKKLHSLYTWMRYKPIRASTNKQ